MRAPPSAPPLPPNDPPPPHTHTLPRLETNKLRNVARMFAHLLYSDAIPWSVLAVIRLTEEDTTSSSRIFIKILFQARAAGGAGQGRGGGGGGARGGLCAHALSPPTAGWPARVDAALSLPSSSLPPVFPPMRAQELAETMGLVALKQRLEDPECAPWFAGVFPTDAPRHMRFAINFFTSIGLGGERWGRCQRMMVVVGLCVCA